MATSNKAFACVTLHKLRDHARLVCLVRTPYGYHNRRPAPYGANENVRFLQKPAKDKRMVTEEICVWIVSFLNVSLGVDSRSSLHEMSATTEKAVGVLLSIFWMSMRKMIDDQYTSNLQVAGLDYPQIMSLGLTLKCSFLQLPLTDRIPAVRGVDMCR